MIKRILIVDDDPNILFLLTQYLAQLGPDYQVEACSSGSEALALSRVRLFDLVISDYNMAGLNVLQLAQTLRERQPELKFILMSGHDEALLIQKVAELGLSGFIAKPFTMASFYAAVRSALES